jgi:hypothetical protein
MIACLHPSDNFFEENSSTIKYASQAALIRNKPTRNDDPQTKLIADLRVQVKNLTLELIRANQFIEMVCATTGQVPRKFGVGMLPMGNQLKGIVAEGSVKGARVTGMSD